MRNEFLTKEFADYPDKLEKIIASGPVQAGIPREMLSKHANKLILARTSQSSVASFAAGIPGGFAMAATIPADVMQFFGMSLRLAQELAYLYGAEDMTKFHDCGAELYFPEQDTHMGGSGCGCAAITLSAKLLPNLWEGRWQRLLFVPTGALLSTTSAMQGNSIPGIAHAVRFERGAV